MASKHFILAAAFASALSGSVSAQKVDLDKFTFDIEYLSLPVNYLAPEQRTYSVNVTLSPMTQGVITEGEAADRLAITNFSRKDAGGAVKVDLRFGNTTFSRSDVSTRKDETKDKNGNVTSVRYYYSVDAWYDVDGKCVITGPKNPYKSAKQSQKESKRKRDGAAPPSENPFLANVEVSSAGSATTDQTITKKLNTTRSYHSAESSSRDEALRAFRINGGSIMQSVHNDFVNSSLKDLGSLLNAQYGYVPIKETYHLWILDSKSHPEYQMQQNAIAAVKELLGRVKAESSTATLETSLKPVMEYFESLKTKYAGDDKRDKKLRYSAYFNLAKLYLVLDYPDKAIEQAQGLIKNDYDPEDGEDLLERAEELKREMEFHHINTRHLGK